MPENVEISLKRKSYNSGTDAVSGIIVFDKDLHKIYVGGSQFSSNVKDATLNLVTGDLVITKTDDTIITVGLSSFERLIKKVTSISSSSTDDEYPSAKCIYELSKDRPVIIWQAQSAANGILASEADISDNMTWQLTNLDMSMYQKVKLFIKSGGSPDGLVDHTTASAIIKIDLGSLNVGPLNNFVGSTVVQYPNDISRLLALTAAISEDKTKIAFTRCTSLYGTSASSENTDGRVLYKAVGYFGDQSHTYQIVGPSMYTGKNFNLQSKYDGQIVPSQWTIVSGSQYAIINQNGRIDIVPNTVSQDIVVQATYGEITDQKTIQISYDNQLVIQGPDTITGESGSFVAMYNNNQCTSTWSITSGNENATINAQGEITILQSGDITVQAVYDGYTTTKNITLVYQSGTTQETTVNPDGSVTETTTTETTDPQTGTTTTETTTTTTNEDGSSSQTTEETTTNQDGSSTTTSTTTNSDGTSSSTESSTSAPDPSTGAVTTESSTTNYDETGNVSGSSETTSTENTDGSSTSSTTNYNAEGDPTTATNQNTDTDGNSSTQNINYDENGNPTVTGYDIDTSDGSGEKTFDKGGVNTEFNGFDSTDGFIMNIHFTIDFTDQPANQDESHHNILTMKRAAPEPWYGLQLRHSSTNKNIILGTQFATGSNTNTNINPPRWVESNKIAEYDILIKYDPTAPTDRFIARELINGNTIFQSNLLFPDISELSYLTVCIGHALDANGDPFRYSNINIIEFSIEKLSKVLYAPTINCDGLCITLDCETSGATIYYRLNQLGTFNQYTAPISINADTYVETYSTFNGKTSATVAQTCIYDDGIEEPVITCNGEQVIITCETPNADIYYRVNHTGSFMQYVAPIQISQTVVVEAYAELDATVRSETVEETCEYIPVVLEDPEITCDGIEVTITCDTAGAEIYYRTGQEGSYVLYTAPFPIYADTVVEAYSVYGVQTSTVVSETCIYTGHDYSLDYLTFKILTTGTIKWIALGSGYARTIQYSKNNGAWTTITSTTAGVTISVNANDVIRFKGENSTYAGSKTNYSGFENTDLDAANFDIEGNIMSLVHGDNFANYSSLTGQYNFCSIFKKTTVISAENLVLPTMSLTPHCYRAMFSNSYSLTTPPALPATTLNQYCYWYMFENAAITVAPDLLADALPQYSCGYMFTGCAQLAYVKCMATTHSATNCTQNWLTKAASSGTFVQNANATWTRGASGIPNNWTIVLE